MLDTRYHIIYLCAIFLMLGFGIIIGDSFIGPIQVRQNTANLAVLRTKVDGALQDANSAKDQAGKLESSIESLRPRLVQNQLQNKRVIIVQTGDSSDAAASARTSLIDAGATTATCVVADKLNALDPEEAQDIASELNTAAPNMTVASDDPISAIIRAITETLLQGTKNRPTTSSIIEVLQHHDLANVTGDLGANNANFVIVGGEIDDSAASDKSDSVIIEGLKHLATRPISIVGCEPLSVATSSIPTYQSEDVASVDCIDQPLGMLDLPFAVNGGVVIDDYGLKSTAHRQIPVSLASADGSL